MRPWIYIGGSRRQDLEHVLQSVTAVDAGDVNSTAEVVLAARSLGVARPARGTTLMITTPGGTRIGGELRVSGMGWDDMAGTTTILGTASGLSDALRLPRDASWPSQTLSEVVGTIAGRSGYEPVVAAALGGITIDGIQVGESDMQFLQRLAGQWGGRVVVRGGRLLLLAAGSQSASGSELPVTAIEIDADAWARGRVRTRSIDVVIARYQTPDGEAGTVEVGAGGATHWMPQTFNSREQAEAAARRRLLDRAADDTDITVTLPLRPGILALYPVALSGRVPSDVSAASLWIESVTHALPADAPVTSTLQIRPF